MMKTDVHDCPMQRTSTCIQHFGKVSKHCTRQIPGLTWYCKHLHADGSKHFVIWYRKSRPRNIELFESIETSRTDFENDLKFCQCNELRIKKEIFVSRFEQKNTNEY